MKYRQALNANNSKIKEFIELIESYGNIQKFLTADLKEKEDVWRILTKKSRLYIIKTIFKFLAKLHSKKQAVILDAKINKRHNEKYSAPAMKEPHTRKTKLTTVISNIARENLPIIHRKEILEKLASQFAKEANKICVITGLGGVGKTQLAKAYANSHMQQYKIIWWLQGSKLNKKLGHKRPSFSRLDFAARGIPALATQGENSISDRVLNYQDYRYLLKELNAKREEFYIEETLFDAKTTDIEIRRLLFGVLYNLTDWLIIFDDIEQEEDLDKNLPSSFEGVGHILITTRSSLWLNKVSIQRLGTFSLEESVNCLCDFLGKNKDDDEFIRYAKYLSEKLLGNLPLAVVQAASYMKTRSVPIKGYIERFLKSRQLLWNQENKPRDYDYKVATTWQVNFDIIKQNSSAVNFLGTCACLDSNNIPRSLLEKIVNDALACDEAINICKLYSLINIDETNNIISIHKLVQTVFLDNMSKEEIQAILLKIIKVIIKEFPVTISNFENTIGRYDYLESHIEAILTQIDLNNLKNSSIISLEQLKLLRATISGFHDFEKSLALLKDIAASKKSRIGDNLEVALIYQIIMDNYLDIEQYEMAHKYAKKCYSILAYLPEYGEDHTLTKEIQEIVSDLKIGITKDILSDKKISYGNLSSDIYKKLDEEGSSFLSLNYDVEDLDETIAYYERYVTLMPNGPNRYRLACLYHLNSELDLAEKLFLQIIKHYKNIEFKFSYAFFLYTRKKYYDAIKLLRKIIDAKPQEKIIYSILDIPFLEILDIDLYENKISINISLLAKYLLIRSLISLKKNSEANKLLTDFKKEVLAGGNAEGFKLLASIYKNLRDGIEALNNIIRSEIIFLKVNINDFDIKNPENDININLILATNKYSIFLNPIIKLACYYDAYKNDVLAEKYFDCMRKLLQSMDSKISIVINFVNIEYGVFLFKRSQYQKLVETLSNMHEYLQSNNKIEYHYDLIELPRLDEYLQKEVENNKEISINPFFFAYYLMILSFNAIGQTEKAISHFVTLENNLPVKNISFYNRAVAHLKSTIHSSVASSTSSYNIMRNPFKRGFFSYPPSPSIGGSSRRDNSWQELRYDQEIKISEKSVKTKYPEENGQEKLANNEHQVSPESSDDEYITPPSLPSVIRK